MVRIRIELWIGHLELPPGTVVDEFILEVDVVGLMF